MAKRIIAGNWKMNLEKKEAIQLAFKLISLSENLSPEIELIIAPPFIHISIVRDIIISKSSRILLAAQNCNEKYSGAYTGEISVSMLKSHNVEYVIIGHSERRKYFNEAHSQLKEKICAILKYHLKPIFCCGETLSEREKGKAQSVVQNQLMESVLHLLEKDLEKITIAYEPVWAIGTGKTATPEQAQEMHQTIRKLIASRYSSSIANKISILYGGSCKPTNAKSLFTCKDIDGGLIGGASLNAEDFLAIAQSY